MTPPDENIFRGLDWLWGGIVSILTLLTGALWSTQGKRIDELKYDLTSEIDSHKEHIAKLFEKLEDHAQKSSDRHIELITAIHNGLSTKQDKNGH